MEYHVGDDFTNPDAENRTGYYGIVGIPDARINGRNGCLDGDSATFSCYLNAYNNEMQNLSVCTLVVSVGYDTTTRILKVKTWATALDTFSNAHLRYTLAESHIHYHWQDLDSLQNVVRKMLPDYHGVPPSTSPPRDVL